MVRLQWKDLIHPSEKPKRSPGSSQKKINLIFTFTSTVGWASHWVTQADIITMFPIFWTFKLLIFIHTYQNCRLHKIITVPQATLYTDITQCYASTWKVISKSSFKRTLSKWDVEKMNKYLSSQSTMMSVLENLKTICVWITHSRHIQLEPPIKNTELN